MKPISISLLLQLLSLICIGQDYYIRGDLISKKAARKDIKSGNLYYLVYGEFASIPQRRCEEEVWSKYGCTVEHISNFGVPEADEYNAVLFNHLNKVYGSSWQIEKDSLMEYCLTNNVCGINVQEWNFSSSDFPDIIFEENKYSLTELSKCMLSDFFLPLFLKVQNDTSLYIRVYSTVEKQENITNLADKRCESVASYLTQFGLNEEKLILEGYKVGIYDDYKFDDYHKFKKWNRAVFFQIIEK